MINCNQNSCNDPVIEELQITDPIPNNCDPVKSLRSVAGRPELGWDEKHEDNGGVSGLCDPMQTGSIVNDPSNPNTQVIYRYSKGMRNSHNAMVDLFRNIIVIDESGKNHNVPIIWGSQERAVAAITQKQVRKDGVVERIPLPTMAIINTSYQFQPNRYIYHAAIDWQRDNGKNFGFTRGERYKKDTVFGTARGIPINIGYRLYAWTLYEEDMNQITEQIILKFSPIAYIRVRGVGWEIGVTLDSIGVNENIDPGTSDRVIKYEFDFTAETFIPQPIVRKPAALKVRAEFLDGLSEEDATNVISRFEEAAKGFN